MWEYGGEASGQLDQPLVLRVYLFIFRKGPSIRCSIGSLRY